MNLIQRIYRLFANLKQRTFRLLGVIIVCLAGLFGVNPSANAATWFVDGGVAECDNDGDSWPNAFKYLQDALAVANGFTQDQIWVKAGEYFVDQSCANEDGSGLRTATFQLVKGVFLLGGFNGTETFAFERDSVANVTILSGAIAQGLDPPDCAANGLSCFEGGKGVRMIYWRTSVVGLAAGALCSNPNATLYASASGQLQTAYPAQLTPAASANPTHQSDDSHAPTNCPAD